MRRGDEPGFTLIELIVVVAVIPIILGAISAALDLTALACRTRVNNRVGDSNDALVASTDFNRDVQSAVLMTTLPSTQATAACGSTSATVTQILALEWGATLCPTGGPTGGYDTVVVLHVDRSDKPEHKQDDVQADPSAVHLRDFLHACTRSTTLGARHRKPRS